jgi:hypothetical protein
MAVEHGERDYIDQLFDSFEVKDMTRRAFRTAYVRLMDPKGIRRDLIDTVDRIQKGRTRALTMGRKTR